jgi:predicted peroxiredoxin
VAREHGGMAKLIFYSTISPDRDDDAWGAFSLARRAAQAGLEAEIFLAGPATGLIRRQVRERLTGKPRDNLQAVLEAKVPIWVAPGCAKFRGVSAEDMDDVDAAYREITEMLKEVAAGAQLVPFIA